jgi:hypothetical protein
MFILSLFYLQQLSTNRSESKQNVINKFEKDISERNETFEDSFLIAKFPKKLKYLKENDDFVQIMENIRFVIKFDKSRYCDCLNNLNFLMKIYIYILAERYDPELYFVSFIDVRDNITDLMYSLIITVPSKFKNIYGIDPYDEIHISIDKFLMKSREMMETLENFLKLHKKINYIPDNSYKPYNQNKKLKFG